MSPKSQKSSLLKCGCSLCVGEKRLLGWSLQDRRIKVCRDSLDVVKTLPLNKKIVALKGLFTLCFLSKKLSALGDGLPLLKVSTDYFFNPLDTFFSPTSC